MNPDDKYEQENDFAEGPTGMKSDNDYVSRQGESYIPVQKDEAPVEDPLDASIADSDQQLERDEKEAINTKNIMKGRTRGATKQKGVYAEPGDEEGLPGPDEGRSSTR
ncbi:uncharacterized protein EI97DRAFT_469102 [Westerdykella ornata]|uniref:Histone chaperone domain-containing protein n=1 Tax=Westerdykella ornata TaxID=318751 RepID=A0A6A6JET7_WESOR|nr:uncharacterized protein EI97DRAFT_469102 [Westerdykella ornata]KAF2274146.1 hypothetical protein EI97DRAFT_469102 [Westerdykella ornata]